MLLQFDEKKINSENQHTVAEIWKIVDDTFEKFNCIREPQADGSVMYYENQNSEDSYADFSYVLIELASNAVVVSNCSKWIWFDDEENDEGVFDEEDVLSQVQDMKFCELAKRGYKK